MPTHLDSSSLTALDLISSDWSLLRCRLVCPSSIANSFLELLCPTLFSRSLTYFRSPETSSPKPFVWFRAKTDKGIVCLADHLHCITDTTIAWKKFRFILSEKLHFHMMDKLSIAFHAFPVCRSTSLSVDEILLPRYVNWSTNFRGLLLKVEMFLCLKDMNVLSAFT